MPFSAGTFSVYTPGNPVVAGTAISSTVANATNTDFATGLSTALLKDGTQVVTADIPLANHKFTGLAAGTSNGDSVRYEQVVGAYLPLSIGTTAGDMVYWTASAVAARLALGAAGGILKVNAGATAPEYLALGTAYQQLTTNAGATSPEWSASLQSLMTGTGDIVQSSGANTPARLAIGTARQVPRVNAGATALVYANPITITAEQASTSGTSIDFNSIPAGVRRITIMIVGVSTNGASNKLIQIGDSGGIETSGYLGASSVLSTVVASTNYTTGAGVASASASDVLHGSIVLTLQDSSDFTWTVAYTLALSNAAGTIVGAASKSLSAELDRVRVTTVNGTDAFDAGVISISYE